MQIALTLAIGGALAFGGLKLTSTAFIITTIAILVASILGNILLFTQLMIPLQNISAALTKVSGEPTDVIPPNPNGHNFERNGLKPLLQLIYETASKSGEETSKAAIQDATFIDSALDQSQAGIVMLNAQREIIYHNKKAPVVKGIDGKPRLELIFDDDKDDLKLWLAECDEKLVHDEKLWLRVANSIVGTEDRRVYDINASYQKGSKAEVVMVFFDRTEVYQPEDDELDFIAFAAHELRGPITVIRGYLDVIDDELKEVMDNEQKELIKRLVVSANRLSGYIANILNASKYDRRHLKLHLVEDSLANIYDSINDDMQLRAASQNRLLSVNIPPDLPTIAADRSSLSEVLANLIDNGLKYSFEGGSINVTASADANFVTVTVEDHGIGMPGSVVSNLFHKFYRSHRSRETVAGTGIGLYICKAFIESHGGQIGVKSTEGQGSTFTFTVPIYATVADKLSSTGSSNVGLIKDGNNWIKNHTMYKG